MGDSRWTIRGVGADIRKIVRQASANTGRPACQIVSEAVQMLAHDHPEVLIVRDTDDEAEFYATLADIAELIAAQGNLLRDLTFILTGILESP